MNTFYLFVCLCISLGLVSGHSWLQCADYAEENGRLWDATACRGYPRAYATAFQPSFTFGGDVGFNYQPTEAQPCRTAPTSSDYTTAYPAATYSPGQRVCLAWPPKNHVAANCNNPNIPDHGTRVYRSGVNPTSDPTLSQFHSNLVYDFGASTGVADTGFQNCPQFCSNADKALCSGCFDIPSNLALGKYTFLWEWAFNADTDLYANCFDVNIVADSGNYVTETYTKQSADSYKALVASGAADTPKQNSAPASYGSSNSKGSSSSSSGMSAGGKAALALFLIAFVAFIAGSVYFVKSGHGTIDTKYPFFHKRSTIEYQYGRTDGEYKAYKEADLQ